jgi:xylulokinase
MEGITFGIANCFEALQAIARARNQTIHTLRTGESGGSRLLIWRQIITDVLELDLGIVDVEEPGCLGAAMLAGVGIGEYRDIQSATHQTVRVSARVAPDPESASLYRERRKVFNETYRALEPILYLQTHDKETS